MAHDSIDLDQPEAVTRRDPHGMFGLATGFPDQCRAALRIAEGAALPHAGEGIGEVVLTGLGGSAAGGDFARALFDAEGRVPFIVNREYVLPAWAGSRTLVFVTSYSGNTEETLSAYDDARRRGARIMAVTSGGELARRAAEHGVPVVEIPAGQPPRTAMGYMLVPVLVAAQRLGLLAPQDVGAAIMQMDHAMVRWLAASPARDNEAKRIATLLRGRLGVLYGLGSWQGIVAMRWKAQINENAKQHVFAHALPEMNHNEILGWEGATRVGVGQWVSLLLEDGQESDRMRFRAGITLELLARQSMVHRVAMTGPTLLGRMLTLALLGDFVSLYLAALNGVDPCTIDSINTIKERLARS